MWSKSPQCALSTMIINDKNMQYITKPKKYVLPKGFFRFRKTAKTIIKDFFQQLKHLQKTHLSPIIIEYKIVFKAPHVLYLTPAKESLYVYNAFSSHAKKTKKLLKNLQIQPQLRKRLSGKSLKIFKKELRQMHLVSRKRETGFEYHLWTIALHATSATYLHKLKQVRKKLSAFLWEKEMLTF